MKCPHCNEGKVVLFTSVECCNECGGSGELIEELTEAEVWEKIAINLHGCKNPCSEIVLPQIYTMNKPVILDGRFRMEAFTKE